MSPKTDVQDKAASLVPGRASGPVDRPYPGDMTAGSLTVTDLSRRFGTVAAVTDVSLSLAAGRSLALLGPSGCGKTTLLRMIAGLETPDSGSITLDGTVLFNDTINVSARKRPVGMVFQDWALFPNMTVASNVAFGLSRQEVAADRVAEVLEMVQLSDLADRKPHQLSAGQAQRVALARTLAPRPRLVLFDEPFSSLDADLRVKVRSQVAELMRSLEISAVFVTHDQDEAFVLGDEIAVMCDGVLVQRGVPADLYQQPATRWVAGFVGDANWLRGVAADGVVASDVGTLVLRAGPQSGPVEVLLRPEELRVVPGDSFEVAAIDYSGPTTNYTLIPIGERHPAGGLRVAEAGPPIHRQGARVGAAAVGERYVAFPAV